MRRVGRRRDGRASRHRTGSWASWWASSSGSGEGFQTGVPSVRPNWNPMRLWVRVPAWAHSRHARTPSTGCTAHNPCAWPLRSWRTCRIHRTVARRRVCAARVRRAETVTGAGATAVSDGQAELYHRLGAWATTLWNNKSGCERSGNGSIASARNCWQRRFSYRPCRM